jgi:hypothetical protein
VEIFGDIERLLSDLYPYRWLITAGLAVAIAAFVGIGFRLGWHRAIARRPLLSAAIALPVAAVIILGGWYTLSPLWERTYLEEASPLEAAAMPTVAPTTTGEETATGVDPAPETPVSAPGLPRQTHSGVVMGADDFHFGRGNVLLIETAPGVYTLRFEDFSVRNGPDLFVYLTPDPSGESVEGGINLGELKATDGAFNYEVPPGTDISQFASAVVWCKQFAVLFAVAELAEA